MAIQIPHSLSPPLALSVSLSLTLPNLSHPPHSLSHPLSLSSLFPKPSPPFLRTPHFFCHPPHSPSLPHTLSKENNKGTKLYFKLQTETMYFDLCICNFNLYITVLSILAAFYISLNFCAIFFMVILKSVSDTPSVLMSPIFLSL